jgi:NTP pyrophosphatase (non-canonical NTP hydrolase)
VNQPEAPDNGQGNLPLLNLQPLAAALQAFADARDWQQFHSPKNLVMALTGEVGELNEIFQWLTEAESASVARQPETATAVKDELADVLMYLVRLADVLGVDLNAAVADKLRRNGERYPVDKARGSSQKYSQR